MSIEFRRRIIEGRRGHQPIGMLVGCSDPAMVEILGHVGYDFAILDNEHSHMGPAQLLPLVRAAQLVGVTPLVRLGDLTRATAQKMLDLGMEGLVAPRVEKPADLDELLKVVRLPSQGGTRGYCPCCHAIGYSRAGWDRYNEHIGAGLMVIPQIESVTAVENVADIVAVDGVDAILFGPGDLAVDMNVEFDSPPIGAAFDRVAAVAKEHDVAVFAPTQIPGDVFNNASALFDGMDLINVSASFSRQLSETRTRVRATTMSA